MSCPEAPDFTSLLQKAKAMYIVKDKFSNQALGYAIMNTDRAVTTEEIRLDRFSLPGSEGQFQRSAKCSLESDLNLSRDSSDSMNKTVEEDLSPISCNEKEVSLSQIRSDTSSAIPKSVNPSTSPSQSVSLDSSVCPAHSQSPLSTSTSSSPVSSSKSTPAMLAPNPYFSAFTAQNAREEAPSELETFTKSFASDIVENAKDSTKSSVATGGFNKHLVSVGKRNIEDDIDEPKKKKVSVDKKLERPSRESISAFYEYVEEGRERKYRRVKCLLCNDGRLLNLDNFPRHIHSRHESPEACENCGKFFSREQLRTHRMKKKCVWQKLEFVEKPASFSLGESKDEEEASPILPPMERHKDESLDTSNSQTLQVEEDNSGGPGEEASSSTTYQSSQARKSEDGDWFFITLAHDSLEKYRSNFKIEKESKVKKLMRAFAKEHKIVYKKHLRFYIGSEELKGEEKVGELKFNTGKVDKLKKNGGEIEVFGKIVDL